jgi:hypothetical protein
LIAAAIASLTEADLLEDVLEETGIPPDVFVQIVGNPLAPVSV